MIADLHALAERVCGRVRNDRLPLPCPGCHKPGLMRVHRTCKMWCRVCWREMTDDDYERQVDHGCAR
jgi:hypothetical protein